MVGDETWPAPAVQFVQKKLNGVEGRAHHVPPQNWFFTKLLWRYPKDEKSLRSYHAFLALGLRVLQMLCCLLQLLTQKFQTF